MTRFEFTDDIDGKALDVEDLTIVTWTWLGVDYEFETSAANLDRIERGRVPVSTLLAKSRRVGGRKRSPSRTRATTAPAAKNAAPADTTTIRLWAQQNGYEVADRGRIPATIIDAYTTEH